MAKAKLTDKEEKMKKSKKKGSEKKVEINKKEKVNNKKKNKVEEVKPVETKKPKLRINRVRREKTKSYADETSFEFSPEVKGLFWTSLVVILVFSTFYLISFFATGNTFSFKNESNVEIQYEEVLLGSSFDLGGSYYVVYYNMNDEDNEDTETIDSSLYNLKSASHDTPVYKCDLGSAFNKPFVTTEEPNRTPNSAEEMLVKSPTIIKFVDGHVENYISGIDDVKSFLDSFERDRDRERHLDEE